MRPSARPTPIPRQAEVFEVRERQDWGRFETLDTIGHAAAFENQVSFPNVIHNEYCLSVLSTAKLLQIPLGDAKLVSMPGCQTVRAKT